MRPAYVASIGAVALLVLSGCSAAASPSDAGEKPSSTPTTALAPTPTIDPGPVELTFEQAAERYLGVVCQPNSLVYQLNDAFDAQEEVYLNGGDGDTSEIKKIAAESLRVNRVVVEILDDPYFTWPESVDEHVQTVRQSYISLASHYDTLVNASSFEAAYYATPAENGGSTAAQEIRYQLGLPADTRNSCEGKETLADTLHKEMTERNEYLASFDDEDKAS